MKHKNINFFMPVFESNVPTQGLLDPNCLLWPSDLNFYSVLHPAGWSAVAKSFQRALGPQVWYSQEPENISNHCSFKEPPFENCHPRHYLTLISHRTTLVRLFIWHTALQPMQLGFVWFWPKSCHPELNIKFVRMKNIVVECPGTTVSQSP